MTTNSTIAVGQSAENIARYYLEKHGLAFIEANFRQKVGEIDLIMCEKGCYVFVEVRYRQNRAMLEVLESVAFHKQRKLRRTAEFFIQSRKLDSPSRFDVIGMTGQLSDPEICWIRNAF